MNKKGFTLIEILAVIVILAVVMLIGTVSVTGIKAKMQRNMFDSKLDLIIGGAKSWGQDNKSEIGQTSVEALIASKYLETEEVEYYEKFNCSAGVQYTNSEGKLMCKVITNNMKSEVINRLQINVYLDSNRVYACIVNTSDNLNKIKDTDGSIVGEEYIC